MELTELLKHFPDSPVLEPGTYLMVTDEDEVDTLAVDTKYITRVEKGISEEWGDDEENTIRVFYKYPTNTKEQMFRPMGQEYIIHIK